MPTHHLSRPSTGLVVMNTDEGLPGGGGERPSFRKPDGTPAGGPSFQKPEDTLPAGPTFQKPEDTLPAGPTFQKPEGAVYQPQPPAGVPGQPIPPGLPVPHGGTYELSGWWRRVGATVIDALILMVPFIPLFLIVAAVFGVSIGSDGDANDAGIIATLFLFFVMACVYAAAALVYAPYFMAKWDGATPGKRAVGIRVVRAEGLPMTFWYAAYREVVVKQLLFAFANLFTFGLASLADYLWPLWDSEQRALHDIVVNTRVVRG